MAKTPAAKSTVALVGASGMLGSMILDVLSRDGELKVLATVRDPQVAATARSRFPGVEWRLLDVERDDAEAVRRAVAGASWVINAIGKTKPYIHDDNAAEVECALRVNAQFPFVLARAAEREGARVLQIATDCVFSGLAGHYVESSKHDALDVYGKSKSMGEVPLPNVMHLRCSIIGPEPKVFVMLLDWFRRQKQGAQLTGYSNHFWNGVTTYQYARLCQGIMRGDLFAAKVQHVVPQGAVSKADLLECFKTNYKRPDIGIAYKEVVPVVDRTLNTERQEQNGALWQAAGYRAIPTIPDMVAELARFDCRIEGAFA